MAPAPTIEIIGNIICNAKLLHLYCVKIHKIQIIRQMSRFKSHAVAIPSLHKSHHLLVVFVALACFCWPLLSDAMSLGRSRGAAVLGRGLDVTALVGMEAQESTPEATCFSAEVFYGESRVNNQNITITPTRTSPSELALRIRANSLIDEPFVTLYVRIACGQSLARRYVLLADSPSEPASTGQAAVVPFITTPNGTDAVPKSPARSNAEGNQSSEAGGASATATTRRERTAQQREAAAARRAQQSAAQVDRPAPSPADLAAAKERREARVAQKQAARAAQQERLLADKQARAERAPVSSLLSSKISPRLKIDLLDMSPVREPTLRASNELLSQPTTDLQARAVAAALWRSLNSSPEDAAKDNLRLKAIEADVRTMSDVSKQQTQELTTLRTDLKQAQSARYANPLVFGLGALALAALGFAAWVWRKRGNDGTKPWWGSVERFDEAAAVEQANAALQAQESGHSASNFAQSSSNLAGNAKGAARSVVYPSTFAAGVGAAAQASADRTAEIVSAAKSASGLPGVAADFANSIPNASRSVNTEELFDIQQQADFFMSLGQHSQAIDILQNHISDNIGTSALAYLDLFDIYHKIGQRDDFETLRDEFNRVFNTQVPEFDQYGASSRGLEDYQAAIERIQALWPNPKVLAVIEESIFRMPDRDAKPFDLLAYRELMLLYAIAKDVSQHDSIHGELLVDFDIDPFADDASNAASSRPQRLSAVEPSSYGATQVQPLSAVDSSSDLLDTTLLGVRSQELIDLLEKKRIDGVPVQPHVDIDVVGFGDASGATPSASTGAGSGTGFEPSPKRGLKRHNPK
jgi:pilus assembly protein FimV